MTPAQFWLFPLGNIIFITIGFKGATLTNIELEELIRQEENTLCAMPYGSDFKERRQSLTRQVIQHREMLCSQIEPREAVAI